MRNEGSPSTHPPGRLGSPCCLGNFPSSAAVDWIRSSAPGPRSRSSRTAGESGRSAADPGIVSGGQPRGSSAVSAAATPTPFDAVRADSGHHCGGHRQPKRRLTRAHQLWGQRPHPLVPDPWTRFGATTNGHVPQGLNTFQSAVSRRVETQID